MEDTAFKEILSFDTYLTLITSKVIKNLVALTKLILARDLSDPSLGFVLKKAVKISNHELTTTPKEIWKLYFRGKVNIAPNTLLWLC